MYDCRWILNTIRYDHYFWISYLRVGGARTSLPRSLLLWLNNMNHVARGEGALGVGAETVHVLRPLALSLVPLMSVWLLQTKMVGEFGLPLVRHGWKCRFSAKVMNLSVCGPLRGWDGDWGIVHEAVKSLSRIVVLFVFCRERICSFHLTPKGIHDPKKMRTTGLE